METEPTLVAETRNHSQYTPVDIERMKMVIDNVTGLQMLNMASDITNPERNQRSILERSALSTEKRTQNAKQLRKASQNSKTTIPTPEL